MVEQQARGSQVGSYLAAQLWGGRLRKLTKGLAGLRRQVD